MRISCNWLKYYIDLKVGPEKLAELLTMAGLTAETPRRTEDDHILEIEITANRPDWLSYIGVARELAAITGGKLKMPKAAGLYSSSEAEGRVEKFSTRGFPRLRREASAARSNGKSKVRITVEEKALCPRYTARVIRNVRIGASSGDLKKKLEAMGLRPVNNIVDITNFCLFETGEPMHAFDLDKIDGGEVIVRRARKGEKIVTIDGVERSLSDAMLVIADRSKPIAIAGVMGALNTEVTGATKNILLEAASFDQISVRRTARALAISTESSYRFERRVDPDNIVPSSDRAASLIRELAGGDAGELVDIGRKSSPGNTITLRLSRLSSVLGLEIPVPKIKKIVTALGINIKRSSKESISMEAPRFRYDLNAEIDIIEEIARIYGYNKIPGTIPPIVEQDGRIPSDVIAAKRIRGVLTGLGADEIITYSLLGRNILKAAGLAADQAVEIKNPLSAEQEVMRPGLMPGMLTAILWNINRKAKDLRLFELGKIYSRGSEAKFIERECLSIGIAGEISSWAEGSRPAGFFDLKGAIETVLFDLGIDNAAFRQIRNEAYERSCAASIDIGGEEIGICGEAAKKILNNFDIKEAVYFCEISLDAILKYANLEKRFGELPKYPSAYRDISLIVQKEVLNSELTALAKSAAGAILKNIRLIDRYAGKQIPEGKVSLTYRLEYIDPSKTLEEKDVSSAHSNILRSLEERYGAKLR
ncbi:MAG: phenylalanine--tRNA ligase subunit beta [Candidatus Omnitrophota bacterium]|nr:phenylalanine--tRNA ligase subunit beta [Candidatus Omnitrophota bacterium]